MDAIIQQMLSEMKVLPTQKIAPLYAQVQRGKTAKEKIYRSSYGLIVNQAKKFHKIGFDLETMVDAGILGLAKAIENNKFDPKKGAWSTYVSYYIRGHMLYAAKYIKKEKPLNATDLLDPAMSAGFLDIPTENTAPATAIEAVVRSTIESLKNPRHREVLFLMFYHHKTLGEVGKIWGISKERTRQIKVEALKEFKKLYPIGGQEDLAALKAVHAQGVRRYESPSL